jgi:hypothetical protein
MTEPAHNDAQDSTVEDDDIPRITRRQWVDDDAPPSRVLRGVLILLALGMLAGGIYWNHLRIKGWQGPPSPSPAASEPIFHSGDQPPPPGAAYPWLDETDYDPAQTIGYRIAQPRGWQRVGVEPGSFAHWLRFLPLEPGEGVVHLADGQPRKNQAAHLAVIDRPAGPTDDEPALAALRQLRSDFLRAAGYDRDAPRELVEVDDRADIQIGDVFMPLSRAHAAMVVDMVVNPRTGEKGLLLIQAGQPPQQLHLLINPLSERGSPWFPLNFGPRLRTPEWTFQAGQLWRFASSDPPARADQQP